MNKIKIIIVDDHQIVRDGINKILAAEKDFELIASLNSGLEAIDFIKKNKADVIIADLSMPDMSGIELTENITTNFPEVKVLILSMFTNEEYIFNSATKNYIGLFPSEFSLFFNISSA